ncbi:hypothetical protein C4D60_Mb02t00760 [Musa balbisiana]|uniref:Uncharacterized protein n=1 Tax=Musa balbisiana TaxID=52838 RepID=A0A4S8I8P7_MUSBA|nr:hypothetical protein C4D60_Mb02t00760 [Musa balbisiana]
MSIHIPTVHIGLARDRYRWSYETTILGLLNNDVNVSEEVERALVKLSPPKIGGRSSPKQIEGSDGRNLQLHFWTRLSLSHFTGGKAEGEQGAEIHVVLIDANTGHVVTSGPELSAKLEVVVLEGDFNNEDNDDWTEEEFDSHVVKEREGKRPLLTGDLYVSLKEGVGTLGEFTFTDDSSWIRSRKFRLGLKIASGFCDGIEVREAKTEAFTVKDHRGEFEDFLRLVVRDPQKLRKVLGSGVSNKMWESLVEHAKTCVLSGKYYVYYTDDTRDIGAIFNNIYEFCGLIAGGQFYSAENLNDNQKVSFNVLVKKAYDNWMHVIEYDGKALLNFTKKKKALSDSSNYSSNDHEVSQVNLQASFPLEQPLVDMGVTNGESTIAAVYSGNEGAVAPPLTGDGTTSLGNPRHRGVRKRSRSEERASEIDI